MAASLLLMPRGRDLFKHNKITKTVTVGLRNTLNANLELCALGRLGISKTLGLQAQLKWRRLRRESLRCLVLHGRFFSSRNALPLEKNGQINKRTTGELERDFGQGHRVIKGRGIALIENGVGLD